MTGEDLLAALSASEAQVADYFASLTPDELAAGGRASGPFVPARDDLSPPEGDARRQELLARWRRVNGRLRTALESWSEESLDTIRMPHPILGKITAREMIYFVIYHAEHHVAATRKRLVAAGPR